MSKKNKKAVGVILGKNDASFRVWAPFAKSVAVAGTFNHWNKTDLSNEGDGYWEVTIDHVKAGQEYKFVLVDSNGMELYKNDPRALQVTTADGNSVIVDTAFEWTDKDFKPPSFNRQVIYELHVGTFNRPDAATCGNFDSVIEKLEYLSDLGINAIELMPIGAMSMDRGWGYAPDYLYAVESLYGGRRGLLEFVNAAHKNGIAVILDVVYNHFGPDEDMAIWQFDGWSQDNKGGIYFYNDWRSATPWGETRPDYGRTEVRQFILDNVRMWLKDCHMDGLRVDSTGYMRNIKGLNNFPDTDLAEGWSLLQAMTALSHKINPSAITIAEDLSGNDYITKATSEGGAGFAAQWEVNLPQVIRQALDVAYDQDRNLTDICDALIRRYNNDAFGRVIYSDSHDTAGNGGVRLGEEISPGNTSSIYARKRSLLASSMVMTAPAIPMIFQGQEFMENGSFNDWQALDWNKAERFSGIVLAHKHLISLRKNQYGNTKGLISQWYNVIHLNEEAKVLAYHRFDEGGPGDDVVVVFNFANRVKNGYDVNFPRDGVWRIRFNSDWKGYSQDFKDTSQGDVEVINRIASVNLGPYAVIILSQDPVS